MAKLFTTLIIFPSIYSCTASFSFQKVPSLFMCVFRMQHLSNSYASWFFLATTCLSFDLVQIVCKLFIIGIVHMRVDLVHIVCKLFIIDIVHLWIDMVHTIYKLFIIGIVHLWVDLVHIVCKLFIVNIVCLWDVVMEQWSTHFHNFMQAKAWGWKNDLQHSVLHSA